MDVGYGCPEDAPTPREAVRRGPERTSKAMRGKRRTAPIIISAAIAVAAATGCQTGAPRRVASNEPGLAGPVEPGTTVVEGPQHPSSTVTWVDRHPLFSKPRDLYESSGNN